MHAHRQYLPRYVQSLRIKYRGISVHSFRTLLAEFHLRVMEAKQDNQLIYACAFDPDLAETRRGYANVVSMSGIWLDTDGGDLAPADFANMLKVPMVIYNSFSSTEGLLKWRVWIPTSHLITPAVHKELVAQIKNADRPEILWKDLHQEKSRQRREACSMKANLTQAVCVLSALSGEGRSRRQFLQRVSLGKCSC